MRADAGSGRNGTLDAGIRGNISGKYLIVHAQMITIWD